MLSTSLSIRQVLFEHNQWMIFNEEVTVIAKKFKSES